jgi:hypothetical protein
MVVHRWGYDPDRDGTLRSLGWSAHHDVVFMQEMDASTVTANRIAANPPIVTEYNDSIDKEFTKAFSEALYAGQAKDAPLTEKDHVALARDQRSALAYASKMAAYRDSYGSEFGGVFDKDQALLTAWDRCAAITAKAGASGTATRAPVAKNALGHVMPWSSEYPLDSTRRLVQLQLPQAPQELVPKTIQREERLCSLFGVPRNIIIAEGGARGTGGAAGVETINRTFAGTIRRWTRLLGDLMTTVYYRLFGSEDQLKDPMLERLLGDVLAAHTQLSDAVLRWDGSEHNGSVRDATTGKFGMHAVKAAQLGLEAAEKRLFSAAPTVAPLRLRFSLPPNVSTEELQFMGERGMLPWKTYASTYLRANDMPASALASPTDPVSDPDDRRALMFGVSGASEPKPPPAPGEGGGGAKKAKTSK